MKEHGSSSMTVKAAVIDFHNFTHSWCVYAKQTSCKHLAKTTKLECNNLRDKTQYHNEKHT